MNAKTEYVPRAVIDNQLLIALDDKSKVAVMLDAADLDVLIVALEFRLLSIPGHREDRRRLAADFKMLRSAAFGREADQAAEQPSMTTPTTQPQAINIVFDGPPGPESPKFVEVETDAGAGIRVGEWIERADGLWALRITELPNVEVAKEDICGFCGLPGADKIPHGIRWPGEESAGTDYVHAECEKAECGRAHAALSDEQRRQFLATI